MKFSFLYGLALCSILTLVGCGGGESSLPGESVDNHDHGAHAHGATFHDAVHELAEMRDTIRDGIAANDEGAYHEPLHEVGHVLESLENLSAGLDESDKAAAKEAITKLFDLFDKVDMKFHGGEGADYADVAAEIDANIASLEALVHADEEAPPADSAEPEPVAPTSSEEPEVTTEPTVPPAPENESSENSDNSGA